VSRFNWGQTWAWDVAAACAASFCNPSSSGSHYLMQQHPGQDNDNVADSGHSVLSGG